MISIKQNEKDNLWKRAVLFKGKIDLDQSLRSFLKHLVKYKNPNNLDLKRPYLPFILSMRLCSK